MSKSHYEINLIVLVTEIRDRPVSGIEALGAHRRGRRGAGGRQAQPGRQGHGAAPAAAAAVGPTVATQAAEGEELGRRFQVRQPWGFRSRDVVCCKLWAST